jgi:4,5-DOPA dioxygenase extradiol
MTGSLKDLYNWSQDQNSTDLMPALFIGHGSPMNGIEDNEFSMQWSILGKEIPRPAAVLVVSAHWLTRGTWITAMPNPRTIHDFGGFPQELFEVQYPAPGSPALAEFASDLISSVKIDLNHEWGLDHGTWTVVRHMYPEADIPVLQLSIDYYQNAEFHYKLGKELGELRKKGVLVIGSGNMVHNLRMVAWDRLKDPEFGFDWALEMNSIFKSKIDSKDHQDLINFQNLGSAGKLAIPTPDHYFPLLYLLGIQGEKDHISFFNDKAVGGSLTMTSVRFG